jgi:hypothetical protein
MTVFNDRELSALVTVFEQAWDEFAEAHAPVSPDMYRFREILARKILALTDQREGDVPAAHGTYQPSTAPIPEGRLVNEVA